MFSLRDGTQWQLVGWKRIEDWIDELDSAWSWTSSEPRAADPTGGYTGYIQSRIADLRRAAGDLKTRGVAPASFAEAAIQSMDDYAPFHQDSENGRLILDIRQAKGADAAIFAHHLLRNRIAPSQASNLSFMQGAMIVAEPSLLVATGHEKALKSERTNFRRATVAVREEYDLAEARRQAEWGEAIRSAGDAAHTWSRTLTKRWLRYSLHARRRERAAMAKLHATDIAFTEKMTLKAPVEYWEKKGIRHGTAERKMRLWLRIYFPGAFLLILGMFGGTGYYLLTTPQETLPPGLFIVASAGLASAAGLLFWVGRLLTKLYLSQHHLRQDAEERATMTTTYLALTEVAAAAEVDRQIILSALFRSSPDGIVKEEGGLDPSIAAALGKFLAKP